MSMNEIKLLDEKASSALRLKDSSVRAKSVASFFAHSGDSWFIEIALFFLWLFSKDQWHQLFAFAAGTIAILAILVLGIKFLIHRRRPEGDWGAIYRKADPHSFPSGHAARLALMTVLAFALGPIWLGFLVLIWTLFVSFARVGMGVHYLSDIFGGWLLGIVYGFLVIPLAPWIFHLLPFIFTNQTSLLSYL